MPVYEDVLEDLELISGSMYAAYEELAEGLPDADHPEWGYDEQLVRDIAEAVRAWKKRTEDSK